MKRWDRVIYFISESGTNNIKIGYARDSIWDRLKQLQTGNPRELRILAYINSGTMKQEKALHKEYMCDKIRDNGEWFKLEKDSKLLDYINKISDSYIEVDDSDKNNCKIVVYKKMKNI